MIDFKNASYLKLKPIDNAEGYEMVKNLLIENEQVFNSFKTVRDMIIMTNKRIIAVNVQGLTGKKKDFTTLPYNKIQTFSVETAGSFDLDSELTLWFSGMGEVKFDFASSFDICGFSKLISNYLLN